MENIENIPSNRKWRLETHFEKIEYVHCKVCEIDIVKQGKYCILCSGSTSGCDIKTIYIEKCCDKN